MKLSRHAQQWLAALALVFSIHAHSQTNAAPASTGKQVFLISIDTLSAQHMSLYGYERNTTPHLVEFVKNEPVLVFNKAWSQGGWTLPSHMTMFTGLFPYRHGMLTHEEGNLASHIKTLPMILKANGYRTEAMYYFVNNMLNPQLGFGRGFDKLTSTDVFGEKGPQLLREALARNKDKNTFYFLHTSQVHDPYNPPDPYRYMFTKCQSKVPDYKEHAKLKMYNQQRFKNWSQAWTDQFDLTNPKDVECLRDRYDGGVANIDNRIKNFINDLKASGVYENSVIILTADHGESFGEKSAFFHGSAWQKDLHVPLIIRYPGVKAARIDDRVLLVDLAPTILELTGAKTDVKFDGYSLVPDSNGKVKTHDLGFSVGYKMDAAYDRTWKYVLRPKKEELYKISEDPQELTNVIKEYPEEAFRLKAEIEKIKLSFQQQPEKKVKTAKKLYWFIPDGMRAEDEDFIVYEWARVGHLPNIMRLMTEGARGYSIPDFPSHTPINFASLLTGAHPDVHGIADGPMHIEGRPLNKPSAPGFSSLTKRVPPIWKTMFDEGKKVFLLSIPGSTPPEIPATVVKGRWGNWGTDSTSIVFESDSLLEKRKQLGNAFKLFFLGEPLTRFVPAKKNGKVYESVLKAHGAEIPIKVEYKSKDQSTVFTDFEGRAVTVKVGQWSGWIPLNLKYKDSSYASHMMISPIKIWSDGKFRIRVLFNGLNKFNTEPGEVAADLTEAIGPQVDHLDNWPPQLIFENEDKRVSMDEVRMSLDWHKKAAAYIPEKYKPDVFIQDTYTPNQMLESRWWQGDVDKTRPGYNPKKAEAAMDQILEMYQGLDSIIGEAMAKKDDDTVIVLSSDHGVCPLHRLVHLNNLFAKKGWLKFTVDPKTGEAAIDWKNTKVVYLKMLHVYINPNGLDGNWKRGTGPEFEKLRDEVIKTLADLKDINGQKPLVKAVKWEDAKDVYKLPQDRIGDLVIEAKLNYFWYEEADTSQKIFSTPLTTGYKQSIDPLKNKCMWTPFLIWGPGIKKGYVFKDPISHVDQLPTIYKMMGVKIPKHVQGRVLEEAFE
ncbi:MAG: hypothetical protein K0R29_2438 [Pseudobdellovibrio sp.]|nr:hypothetical protein [Pseudobdellovibrio sp.]